MNDAENIAVAVYEDDAAIVDLLNHHLASGKALRPPLTRDKRTISARISITAHTGLQRIAKELGYVHNGHGNVSLLLEAIGTHTIEVKQMPLQARRI